MPTFYLNWAAIGREQIPDLQLLPIDAYLTNNGELLQKLQARFPEWFADQEQPVRLPLAVIKRHEQERIGDALDLGLIGNIDQIGSWDALAHKLGIPEPLCLEGEEMTPGILDQFLGQVIDVGTKIKVDGKSYALIYTDLFPIEAYGQICHQRSEPNDSGCSLLLLIEAQYIDFGS